MGLSLVRCFRSTASALVFALALSGCETFDSQQRNFYDRQVTIAGVGTMINSDAFEEIDLVRLLDPDNKANYSRPRKNQTNSK